MKSFLPVFVAALCCQLRCINGRILSRSLITSRLNDHFEYLPDIEDAILRMTDADSNGAISYDEIHVFLATPGVPQFLRNTLTSDVVQAADSNLNSQVERYELQAILMDVLKTFPSRIAVIQALTFETELMVNRGEIPVPTTRTDVALTVLDVLDSNNNHRLSLGEAEEFYSLVVDQRFWEDLVLTATALDTDGDNELNVKEIIAVYMVMEEKYSSLDVRPMIYYGRTKAILGRFPTPER